MTNKARQPAVIGFLAAAMLGGCGTSVPRIQDVTDERETPLIIDSIVSKANCELQSAIQQAILSDEEAAEVAKAHHLTQGRRIEWLDKWIADIVLTITIDEKSGLSPGITTNSLIESVPVVFANKTTLPTAQSVSVGLGATVSADATRKDTLEWLIDFSKFTDPASMKLASGARQAVRDANHGVIPRGMVIGCQRKGSLIEGDLQISDWLAGETIESYVPNLPSDVDKRVSDYQADLYAAAKASKKGVLGHDVTFVLLYSGNVNPSWKLIRISGNTGTTPFLSGQRTKTQDLLLTLGPPAPPTTPLKPGAITTAQEGPSPSQQVLNSSLAGQIGIAVANSIRNIQ